MKLSDQFITLEQARKLQKLWFEKESHFIFDELWAIEERYFRWHLDNSSEERVPAYTASELIEYLPSTFEWLSIKISKCDPFYYVEYDWSSPVIIEKNLANALCNMLIYILEQVREEI
jgi:hypothetical protein